MNEDEYVLYFCGLAVTDRCNLHCRHCRLSNRGMNYPEYDECIDAVPNIQGVFFYFHTPCYGYDDLYLGPDKRKSIIRSLLQYKKKYSLLNSQAGLKSAYRNDWRRPLDICHVYESGKIYTCCRMPDNPDLCRNCGYLSYPEIVQVLKLKPSAVMTAVKYF